MLKIKVTKDTVNVSTVDFLIPNYVGSDKVKSFVAGVNKCSYDYLMSTLEADDDDDDESKARKELIKNAVKGLSPEACKEAGDRAIKAFTIGIGHMRSKSVPAEYVDLHKVATDYVRTYRETTDWSDDRKKAFNTVRENMEKTFSSIMYGWVKKTFTLKLTSKAVNSYIEALLVMKNDNGGKLLRTATTYRVLNIQQGFMEYMKAINTVTGVTREKKTKVVSTF